MVQENKSFENYFRDGVAGHRVTPSDKVLRAVKRKLFFNDFISLNPRRINIFYVIVFTGIVLAPVKISKNRNSIKESTTVNQKSSTSTSISEKVEISNAETRENITKEELTAIPEKPKMEVTFGVNNTEGCVPLTVKCINRSINAEQFEWDFGNGEKSTSLNPTFIYNKPGNYTISLLARTKDGKTKKYSKKVVVYSKPASDFSIDLATSSVENRSVKFVNHSTGAKNYTWKFGDNTTSTMQNPLHKYANYRVFDVAMIATSENGCSDTAYMANKFIEHNYTLVFPRQFKPNISLANNGVYERPENAPFVFYPENNGAENYNLTILTASGNEVFQSTDISRGWNGYIRGRIAPQGTYIYKASGVYPNGKDFEITGKLNLVIDRKYDSFYNQ